MLTRRYVASQNRDALLGATLLLKELHYMVWLECIQAAERTYKQMIDGHQLLLSTPWFLFRRRRRINKQMQELRGTLNGLKEAISIINNTPPSKF